VLTICKHFRLHAASMLELRSSVASSVVPEGNIPWILLQEGRSLNLRLRQGVGQVARTSNKLSGKCTGVYYMWMELVTRRRGHRNQKSNTEGWLVSLHWMMSWTRMPALVTREYTQKQGWPLSRVLLVSTLVSLMTVQHDTQSRDGL